GDYPLPRKYLFAPPRGVGPGLYNLINYPERLRAQLITNWDKHCRRQLTLKEEVPLTGPLREYVENFDFARVGFLTPKQIIDQHRRTDHFYRRFKVEPPSRPNPDDAPADLQTSELRYVACLLAAYADHLKKPITIDDLKELPSFA